MNREVNNMNYEYEICLKNYDSTLEIKYNRSIRIVVLFILDVIMCFDSHIFLSKSLLYYLKELYIIKKLLL